MTIRAIPRTAIDGYLKLVRVPLDSAIGLLPGNGTGARLEERRQQTKQQREQANTQAKARRQKAAREQEKEKRRAAKAQSARLDAGRRAARRAQRALDDRAPKERQRLTTLNAKTDALSKKEKELTARDEARRLRETGGRAKTERKDG